MSYCNPPKAFSNYYEAFLDKPLYLKILGPLGVTISNHVNPNRSFGFRGLYNIEYFSRQKVYKHLNHREN